MDRYLLTPDLSQVAEYWWQGQIWIWNEDSGTNPSFRRAMANGRYRNISAAPGGPDLSHAGRAVHRDSESELKTWAYKENRQTDEDESEKSDLLKSLSRANGKVGKSLQHLY